jgi:hypothetical protein
VIGFCAGENTLERSRKEDGGFEEVREGKNRMRSTAWERRDSQLCEGTWLCALQYREWGCPAESPSMEAGLGHLPSSQK